MNGNVPFFDESDRSRAAFEDYAPLDALGRCGAAFALVGRETMPTGERGSIGMVKPSGWQTTRYDWIDGQYLFNRCHLIGFQLAGENDNERNLITGTRSLNTLGMLPYEERVASYIWRTENHVLYRVTPVFEGEELVARGVLMEALSVEDSGAGVRFCAWCYNVEPGVEIDYATGESRATGESPAVGESSATGNAPASSAEAGAQAGAATGSEGVPAPATSSGASEADSEQAGATAGVVRTYVLNTNTGKFHYPDCRSVKEMAEHNRQVVELSREEIIAQGYTPCGRCNP